MTTEQALLQRARQFDESALIEVYDRFSPGLYRYAMRLLGDVDLAEDCVGETFSRFLFALKHGRGPSQYLQAYLYRVAHNWITDHYRRQPPPPLELKPDLQADPEDDPHQTLVQHLESQRVRSALAGLTPDQRQVIVLKYLEDWENKAIAEALDKPIGAVKALQHRALAALRRLLIGEEVL
jgi:RNA polymerase sigma-70 factor (ECF subfamily)